MTPIAAILRGGKLLNSTESITEGEYEGNPDKGAPIGETEAMPEDGDGDFPIN